MVRPPPPRVDLYCQVKLSPLEVFWIELGKEGKAEIHKFRTCVDTLALSSSRGPDQNELTVVPQTVVTRCTRSEHQLTLVHHMRWTPGPV